MVRNKKAWIKVLESTIAVMILAGTLIYVYSQNSDSYDSSAEISVIQKKILNDISVNSTLRDYALIHDEQSITDYANALIPDNYEFEIKICDEPQFQICKLSEQNAAKTIDKAIFVEDVILSGNLTSYNPKKVRLFVWLK